MESIYKNKARKHDSVSAFRTGISRIRNHETSMPRWQQLSLTEHLLHVENSVHLWRQTTLGSSRSTHSARLPANATSKLFISYEKAGRTYDSVCRGICRSRILGQTNCMIILQFCSNCRIFSVQLNGCFLSQKPGYFLTGTVRVTFRLVLHSCSPFQLLRSFQLA
jgi:hypothetical protein